MVDMAEMREARSWECFCKLWGIVRNPPLDWAKGVCEQTYTSWVLPANRFPRSCLCSSAMTRNSATLAEQCCVAGFVATLRFARGGLPLKSA